MLGISARNRLWLLMLTWTGIVVAAWFLLTAERAEADEAVRPPMARGAEIFASYCAHCHGADGSGVDGVRSIRRRPLWSAEPHEAIRTLVFGAVGTDPADASNTRPTMPPIPYGDADVAAVTAYCIKAFTGTTVAVTAADVRRSKEAHRREVLQRLRGDRR